MQNYDGGFSATQPKTYEHEMGRMKGKSRVAVKNPDSVQTLARTQTKKAR